MKCCILSLLVMASTILHFDWFKTKQEWLLDLHSRSSHSLLLNDLNRNGRMLIFYRTNCTNKQRTCIYIFCILLLFFLHSLKTPKLCLCCKTACFRTAESPEEMKKRSDKCLSDARVCLSNFKRSC